MNEKAPKSPSSAGARMQATALAGKVALVTGSSQGIGLEIAGALRSERCHLVLCARRADRLRKVQERLSSETPVGEASDVISVPCDVRDEDAVARLATTVRERFARVDILVNAAGIAIPMHPVRELPLSEWRNVLDTNLTGTFLVTRALLPLMKPGSVIANVLSMSAKRAFPNQAAYNASKFGALGFTNTLREELRGEGVRVIALLPGATDTPIWDTLWPDAPRHKMIRPETVAQTLVAALKLPPEANAEEIDLMPTSGSL